MRTWFSALAWLLAFPAWAQPAAAPAFTVVPLGVQGGLAEGNLSADLVAAGNPDFIALDAGSPRPGTKKAVANPVFTTAVEVVLRQAIKGYCLSHPHLDHVAGLLFNAPYDAPKPIYALPAGLATLQEDYFNWLAWPSFGDEGRAPAPGKYQLRALVPGQATLLAGTALSEQAFGGSHGPGTPSTAFLVRSGAARAHQLRAIFIGASYPNAQPVAQLFSHLTPALLHEVAGPARPAHNGHVPQAHGRQRSPHRRAASRCQYLGPEAGAAGVG